MYRNRLNARIVLTSLFLSCASAIAGEGFETASVTGVQYEYNTTSWAAANLIDDNLSSQWLSRQQTNDIVMQLSNVGDPACFSGLGLYYGTINDRNIKRFALLTTSDDALANDFGTAGWRPIVADANPTYLIDYLSWPQGARIVDIDTQHNVTTWAGAHLNDGDLRSRWLSLNGYNVFEYNFDTDWNGATGDAITIDEIEVYNYSSDDRSVKEFQIEVTQNGSDWFRLEVPASAANDPEYIYTRKVDGGILGTVDSAYNATSWSGDNINDGFHKTRWLSRKGNNTIEFTFDPDRSGTSGANGDVKDLFQIEKIRIENYADNDDRSIRQFQVAVKRALYPNWQKIPRPQSVVGEANFDFALLHHGGQLTEWTQYNSTSWAAKNIHDGDQNTRWLSRQLASKLAFAFDPEENGAVSEPNDLFTMERFRLRNYGVDDRSIKLFQIEVQQAGSSDWVTQVRPDAIVGEADFNFALINSGGTLVSVDSEYNSTSWGAKNLHDGSHVSRWLSRKTNNTLEFAFDINRNGIAGEVDPGGTTGETIRLEKFVLQNYGNDDRSIQEFQVEAKVLGEANWRVVNKPGSTANEPNFDFALVNNGGDLFNIDSEYNSTSWAAANLNSGDQNTRWLSGKMDNNLDFQFDANADGTAAGTGDTITVDRIFLRNYGNDDRAVKLFQIGYKQSVTDDWTYIEVPGTSAGGDAGYNFALQAHGGTITSVDSEYNSTSWGAKNLHDGDKSTRWLSRKQDNTIEFEFDTDLDGTAADGINLEAIGIVNYGNDDRSVATFQIEYKTAAGIWLLAEQPITGLTVFNPAMNGDEQTFDIKPLTGVTAVRFKSITNYGDASYTGLSELKLIGTTVGATYSFNAAMNDAGEFYELGASNLPANIVQLRFRTVTNHGDASYIGAKQIKILGQSKVASNIFVADMNDSEQVFTLDVADQLDNVIGVRLKTISNYGDRNYVGAKEFKILGPSETRSTIFTAAMNADEQTFELDQVIDNVTGVRLVTINNYGDNSYVGAKEFSVLGPSVTRSPTFTASMQKAPETFVLDELDIPKDVTEVKFITINNYGDPTYIGAREFEVVGKSVTPAHSFYLPQSLGPHRIVLDDEDKVTGITGVKFVTINNHGDPSYTGMTELKLFGTPVTPSYIFDAAYQSGWQTFNFETQSDKYLRLHTMTNYGDNSYTWANELSLVAANCAAGEWFFDESSWNGTTGEIKDNSNNEFHGTAFGAANGTTATTNSNERAIAGSPGSCRYGEFDGEDDLVSMSLGTSLSNTEQFTMSFWFNADQYVPPGQDTAGVFGIEQTTLGILNLSAFFSTAKGKKLNFGFQAPVDNFSTTQDFELDTWYHVALVFDNTLVSTDKMKVYVNGVLEGSYIVSATSLFTDPVTLNVGSINNSTSDPSAFDGSIDEVTVYPFAYSQSKVQQIMNKTRPCPVELDHIRITHTGSGVSCASHSVDLTACANSDCSAIYNGDDISFTLQKQTSSGTGDLGTYTISGATGQLNNATFNETEVGTFTLTGTTTATPNVQCQNQADMSTSCDYSVASSGFIVTSGDNQVVESCSANSITIQAVRSPSNPGDGACIPDYSNTNKPLTFQFNYLTPDASNVVHAASATIEGQVHNAGTTGTAENVAFDGTGSAVIDTTYAEAGLISIIVNDDSGVLASTSATLGFAPANLSLDWADGTADNTAGIAEQVSIVGTCSDGTVTQNYIPSGQFEAQATRTAPSDAEISAANPSIVPNDLETLMIANKADVNPNGAAVAFDVSGSNTQVLSLSYDEAATIQTSLADTNYLGRRISSSAALSGSFAISYYESSVNTPVLSGACNAFTYIGQELGWSTLPEVTLTAKNALNQTTEFADINGYWQQNVGTMGTEFINNSYVENNSVNNNIVATVNNGVSASETDDTPLDGARRYQMLGQTLRYNKTRTPDAPFDANVDLAISRLAFIDSNGVGIKNDVTDTSYLGVDFDGITGSELAFGRLNVKSNFGSELETLPWRAQIEIYNASGFWQLQNLDSCTTFNQADVTIDGLNEFDVQSNPPQYTLDETGATTYLEGFVGANTVTANAGNIVLPFAATGDGNIGSFNIDVSLLTENQFLRWDWDNDGLGAFVDADNDGIDDYLDDNVPTTTVTFGRYRGNDRIIYRRER